MRLIAYLFLLLMTGCTPFTFRVETRTDKQIEEEQHLNTVKKLNDHCIEICKPYKALSFVPIGYRCQCEVAQ